jgi:hypothetical protein
MNRNQHERGITLAEVMMAVAILGILIFATVTMTTNIMLNTKNTMDKQFGTQKAIAMLEELKALVQTTTGTNVVVLDGYDDGTGFYNRLTTQGNKLTDPPGDPISGNTALGSGWLYSRQISVKPLTDPGNPTVALPAGVRLVNVRVYKNIPGGRQLIAEVASVVRSLAISYPPSQAYDVYCVALENVPGWWVNLSSLIPFAQSAIGSLQTLNPGLVIRQHWITKLAYGRDSQYVPFVNLNNSAGPNPNPVNSVYFYPGALPLTYTPEAGGTAVASAAQYYYPSLQFQAKIRNENGLVNGLDNSAADCVPVTGGLCNPNPYTLADQYNHAMRWPDEMRLYLARLAAVNTNGAKVYPNEEMTLRLLLDDMVMNPNNYTNAIVINLHGELLPFPPIRNYSDAAKKPDYYHGTAAAPNGLRVVTHPQQIAYDLTASPNSAVDLRVYSYLTNPSNAIFRYPGGAQTALWGGLAAHEFMEGTNEPITLVLRGLNWTPAQTAGDFVQAVSGGVDLANSGSRQTYSTANAPTTDSLVAGAHQMYFTRALTLNGDTVIKLYNSPLVTPCLPAGDPVCTGGGLPVNRRLYGMEYIPAPLEDFTSGAAVTPFSTANNLDAVGDQEKNTARWILRIPSTTLGNGNGILRVETYIGDYDPVAGTFAGYSNGYAQPTDVSTTYLWRGTNTYLYGNATTSAALPPSERVQFQGDPRHCPYADLKMPHNSNSGAFTANTNLGMGYNRYFDSFENSENATLAGQAYYTPLTLGPGGAATPPVDYVNTAGSNAGDFTSGEYGGAAVASTYDIGSTYNILTLTSAGTTSTGTTTKGHGLVVGDPITVANATQAAYNGNWTVASITLTSNSITSITRAGTTVTVSTAPTNHGLTVGDQVRIAGANQVAYNGTWPVATVPTLTTFTYNIGAATPATPATTTVGMTESVSNQFTYITSAVPSLSPATTTTPPITVAHKNNKCYLKIDGGATVTVTLTAGAPSTNAQIATDFNTALGAAALAFVDPGNRIRVKSATSGTGSSVQFTTGASQCNATLGFDTNNTVHGPMWPGWKYTIGGTQYGVKFSKTAASGVTELNAGWQTTNGSIEFDVPRAFQMWRNPMMTTNALFTTMTGWPYYYMGIGNEIGFDAANQFADNIPVSRRPFFGTDAAQYFENTITPGTTWGDQKYTSATADPGYWRSGSKLIQEADVANPNGTWWSKPWIGELYPDKMYDRSVAAGGPGGTDWKSAGNLPTPCPAIPCSPNTVTAANAANTYLRVRREDVLGNIATDPTHTLGTTFNHSVRRTHEDGMPFFFWTSGSAVEADSGGNTGNIAAGGTEINNNYGFRVTNGIPANRPFQLAASLPGSLDAFGQSVYGASSTVSSQVDFYDSDESSRFASSLIATQQGTTNNAMFVVENGLSPAGITGTTYISQWSYLSLIQGFLAAGLFNGSAAPAVAQVPRVVITSPNASSNLTAPTTINIAWSKQWLRWDGKPYTTGYASTWTSATPVSYLVMYSADYGQTWKYVQDDAAVTPGQVPRPPAADTHWVTSTTYAWPVPAASFPAGGYIIRVEAYRNNFTLHYSFHQYLAFINR